MLTINANVLAQANAIPSALTINAATRGPQRLSMTRYTSLPPSSGNAGIRLTAHSPKLRYALLDEALLARENSEKPAIDLYHRRLARRHAREQHERNQSDREIGHGAGKRDGK